MSCVYIYLSHHVYMIYVYIYICKRKQQHLYHIYIYHIRVIYVYCIYHTYQTYHLYYFHIYTYYVYIYMKKYQIYIVYMLDCSGSAVSCCVTVCNHVSKIANPKLCKPQLALIVRTVLARKKIWNPQRPHQKKLDPIMRKYRRQAFAKVSPKTQSTPGVGDQVHEFKHSK